MSFPAQQNYSDWLRGWKEWARTRKRGRMAQFIIEKLEEGKQAKWLNIQKGLFELTEWHTIAKEWFGEKPRNSEEVDAPCMLRKGLPRAFPGLEEVKERSRKEGTQYRSRVFQASAPLMQEVLLHMSSHGAPGAYSQEAVEQAFIPPAGYTHFSAAAEGFNIPSSSGASNAAEYYAMMNSMVKLEYPPQGAAAPNLPTNFSRMLGNGDPQYLSQSQQFDMEFIASNIAAGDMDTTPRLPVSMYQTPPPAAVATLTNGWPPNDTSTSSTTAALLSQMPTSPPMYSVDDASKGYVGSPGLSYHHSPVSSHSPRISPEPSHLSTSSYPPSVADIHQQQQQQQQQHHHQQQSVINGPVDLSPSNAVHSPTIIVADEPQDIMEVKVLPNSSPVEGGGHMALLFYQPLPIGRKVVYFISMTNRAYYQAQLAVDENPHTLSCPIPKFPSAEMVELCIYCDQQPIASTYFTYYQVVPTTNNPEVLLQLLNSQLQSHFQLGGGGASGGMGTGGGASGQSTSYSGYVPTSMYELLLGACRIGCEPLVYCLLCSPAMEKISAEQIREALECAEENGHADLSEHLSDLHMLHDMATPPSLLSRGEGDNVEPPAHVPAYYDTIDQLDQGGDTPQERAETVLKQVLEAIEKNKALKEEKEAKQSEQEDAKETEVDESDVITPTVESLTITDAMTEQLQSPSGEQGGMKRRLSSSSRLIRQTNSISDEEERMTSLKPLSPTSRQSLSEMSDEVADLPYNFRKLPINQLSEADSAIGLSFDDDSSNILFSDVRRRSSQLSDILTAGNAAGAADSYSIKLTQQEGIEVANSLDWESTIVVTSDYPPNSERRLFYRGDQIVQVGDRSIRNISPESFAELFQNEAANGTTVVVVPSPTEKSTSDVSQRLMFRPSNDSVTSRVNQILSMKPASQERKVTVARSSSGLGFKVIGGKTVGVFVSDVRPEVTQLTQGDQILDINGSSTQGLTLYEVNLRLQQSVSKDLLLTVIENKAKFTNVKDQYELDSFYLRSLVDHTPSNNREMQLKKGSLLRVINTFVNAPHHWLAWSIDEATGIETQLKKIPSPQNALKQFGTSAYERVQRSEIVYRRPVCVLGETKESTVATMCGNESFKLCQSIEDVLKTCAEGTHHGVYAASDMKEVQLLTALQPIVLQKTSTDASRHLPLSKGKIDAHLTGDNSAQQAIDKVRHIQTLPVWRPMGLIN